MNTTDQNFTTIDTINVETNASLFGAISAANYCLYMGFTAHSIEARITKSVAAIPSYLLKDAGDDSAPIGCERVEHSSWHRWVEAWRCLAQQCVDGAMLQGKPQILAYLMNPESQAEALASTRKPKADEAAVIAAVPGRFTSMLGKGAEKAVSNATDRRAADAQAALHEIDSYANACCDPVIALTTREMANILGRYVESTTKSVEQSIGNGFYHGFDGSLRTDMAGELILLESIIKDAELEQAAMLRESAA